ncbi:hypothetical protein FGO68_gene16148 [Halteria grandinella]|uniref:Uncharacterized protein n=1 Tax=Halteria grandinella TaxID=5974 RepID=A0A8J8NJ38_HALGN|nr:hypothetical protein FGO68_gene16148 [Halteria grandinella]
MFKNLFGALKAKPQQPASIPDPHSALQRISDQIDNIEKRIKKIEVDMKTFLEEALCKKRANDQRGALFALKRKKMLEKEVSKLDGQMTLLEQQRIVIQASVGDVDVMSALSHAHVAVQHLSQKVSVEQLEDIRDKIEEQNQDTEERTQFFIEAGKVAGGMQEEELLDELNELEAEMAQKELDQVLKRLSR